MSFWLNGILLAIAEFLHSGKFTTLFLTWEGIYSASETGMDPQTLTWAFGQVTESETGVQLKSSSK